MGMRSIARLSLFAVLLLLFPPGAAAQVPPTPDEPADDLTAFVFERIGEQLGVEVAELTLDTDLVADLGADPMTAFEILVQICEEENVELPENPELTRIGDIVEYVRDAPQKEPLIVLRGAETKKYELEVQTVFYGTDRNLVEGARDDTARFYGTGRSELGKIHYGTCEVTIPVDVHRKGKLERPDWKRFEFREDPRKHIVLRRIDPLDRGEFLALLDATFAGSPQNPDRDVLVFVHGFNVTFAAAARRTAQMAYDLEFAGVPMFFSWPSAGRLHAYVSDREDAEWAVLHLERFLLDLKENSQTGRIHLVAHSMGNQAIIRTLYGLALRNGNAEPLLENVIMAAPDFDAHRFVEQIAPQVVPLARRWTLYASEKDFALDISTSIAAKRLGLPLAVPAGVDTVDASGIDVAPWSVPETHGYFSSKQRVIRDLRNVLLGRGPDERDLVRRLLDGQPYWALKPLE